MTAGPRRRSTGPDKLTVEALWARSRGLCEISGLELHGERGVGWHVHHRRPRGSGGTKRPDTNRIENLLLLSAAAHARVESERTEAYARGWLVRQSAIPAAVPVLVADRIAVHVSDSPTLWLVILTDDGGYRPVIDAALPEVLDA